ncbi:MAG: Gfo/Idh/MocA family oxidoreductase [Planctomycetes bacterium]|nr:Gfo/Idh/MocA family oxidoreductase [Planctomycetota bacterium]
MSSRQSDISPQPTRREFLAASATVSAAAVCGVHVAGSDTIRIGMVGSGGRCAGAAFNAMNVDAGVRLVAMCDLFLDRVHQKREALRVQKPDQVAVDDDHCFDGFDGYLKVIESVDVVLIANAAKFHPLHMRAALEAGKHVFVEKPHAIDPAGIRDVVEACRLAEEKKLCVVSGLHSRFDRGYRATVEQVHEGAIGDVVAIEENYLRAPYGLYARAEGMGEVAYQCSNQYHFHWLSGDDVPQSLIHNIDRSIWVMGGRTPIKCHGLGGRSTMTAPIYGNVFDHHSVVYEFDRGERIYAFCRTTTGCHNEVSSIVLGTKGQANLLRCQITGENAWRYTGQRGNPYDDEHAALFAAIRAGEVLNSGYHMVDATRATVMGQLSCYTGEEMTWERMLQSDYCHAPAPADCSFDMEPPVRPGADGTYPVFQPGVTRLL